MSTRTQTPFGALLLRYRAAAHLTQEQLAARAGLSVDAIAALERGKRRTPRGATVELLAGALGLDDAARAELLAAVQSASVASVASVAEDAAGTRKPTRRWLLPAELTPLVDRCGELATILQRLAVVDVRLLTLTGPAGVGKTRLALAAAAQLAEERGRFPDGVTLVDLTPVRDPDLVLGAIAQALGLLDVGSRPALERLAEALENRRLLMVLDNVEQVLPAAPSLVELLVACSGLALLVTSRVPLRLRWEQTLRVAPLPVPDTSAPLPPLEELAAIPSVALFVQRARAHRADFALSERLAPVVARLAAQLDGLPLALELAAARTGTLSLSVVARRLGDRLRLLRWEAPDVPERQQSLEAAVGWSYDLLSEAERRLFRCLGVCAGRVSLEAITAVVSAVRAAEPEAGDGEAREARAAGRTLPWLLSLAEKSLVLPVRPAELAWQQGGGEEAVGDKAAGDRADTEGEDAELAFGMLETVREYAEERLAAAGELAAARRAHAHAFLALAERGAAKLRGPQQRRWFLRLERELDNLRAALRWLLDQEEPAERAAGLRLAAALGWFWVVRGYLAEGGRWLEEALARAPQADDGDGDEERDEERDEEGTGAVARTRALVAAGPILVLQGEGARARAVLEEGLALAERRRDLVATAEAHMYLGMCAVFAGEREEAARLLQEAQRGWETLGAAHGLGQTLFYLGVAADATGDAVAAAAHYRAALRQLAVAGDARLTGVVDSYLGVVEWERGELARAVEHIQAAVRTGVALRDRYLLSFAAQAAAALVAVRAEAACGARLLGATDALAQAIDATHLWERLPAAQEVAGLRERLARGEEAELAAAYRAGRVLPVGEVAALALRLLEEFARELPPPDMVPDMVPDMAPGMAPDSARTPERPSQPPERSQLSTREREVLRLIADGLSSKEIARRLSLFPSTINQHVRSIFNKLGADTRAQAVAVAAQRGLL